MIDVNVSVSGIIMCCDDSICGLNLGNGYYIEKCSLNSLDFKEKIMDANQLLSTDYFGSQVIENDEIYFYCLKKNDTFQIEGPEFTGVITDEDMLCENELSLYTDKEMTYLNKRINVLRLFKEGNIGFRDVFFKYTFNVLGIMTNTVNHCSHNQTRNVIDSRIFALTQGDIVTCNEWLNNYCSEPYEIMKDSIEEFSWGLEQIDIPTGFEQFTTALEMTLLTENSPGKKQMLSNRISALLGTNAVEIQQIHQKILDYYRYRSESLHEGNGANITEVELIELENITRKVLCKFLEFSKNEFDKNPNITWNEIKTYKHDQLFTIVTNLKNQGILV